MAASLKKRYEWIDIAKGFGMLLIILGHCVNLYSHISTVIYSFHMPMFFILSGLFAKADADFKTYFVKRFRRLMLPYFFVLIFGTAVYLLFNGIQTFPLKEYLYSLLEFHPKYCYAGQLWFLSCLFFANILFYFIDRLILKKYGFWFRVLTVIVLLLLGYYLPYVFRYLHWNIAPFNIDSLFMATAFYCIGYLMKDAILDIERIPVKEKLFTAFLCLSITAVLSLVLMDFISFVSGKFGSDIFLFLVTSFGGSFCVLAVSSLPLKNKLTKVLEYIGSQSLDVMLIHSFMIAGVVKVISLISATPLTAQKNLTHLESLITFAVSSVLSVTLTYFYHLLKKKIHVCHS